MAQAASVDTVLPSQSALEEGLTAVLRARDATAERVSIRARRKEGHWATYPSEIVTCSVGAGREVHLFCKYGTFQPSAYGHKFGVAYEAMVYKRLRRIPLAPVPRFYGVWESAPGQLCLVIEHVAGATRFDAGAEEDPLTTAAAAIARLHCGSEEMLGLAPGLIVYDTDYFVGWAMRTARFASEFQPEFPWLKRLCERFAEVAPLLVANRCLVHGEFYRENILLNNDGIFVVDWESAAFGAGEIDLAALSEGRSSEASARSEMAYAAVRYPRGTPAEFARTVDAARLYLHFRWLGDHPARTIAEKAARWRFPALLALGRRLRLIDEKVA